MELTNDQSGYWDKVAGKKTFSHPLEWERILPFIDKASNILDYGCGYGRSLFEFKNRDFKKLFGVDYSSGMIEEARKALPELTFSTNSGTNIPFSDQHFDLVLLFAVINCIPLQKDLLELASEIKRVLAPGGILYISDLLLQEDERNRTRYEQNANRFGHYGIFELPEGAVFRHFKKEEIESIFSDFEIKSFHTLPVATMNGNAAKAFQMIGRII